MDLDELMDDKEYEEPEIEGDCPKCADGKILKRHARNFEGREFLGCSNYPFCNYIKFL